MCLCRLRSTVGVRKLGASTGHVNDALVALTSTSSASTTTLSDLTFTVPSAVNSILFSASYPILFLIVKDVDVPCAPA